VLIVLFLGFSAGLPLALSGSTLLVWMREAGIDLGVIGLFALVGTPYTIKFLWAPVVDALDVPLLGKLFGRRRGWLLLSQLFLMIAIALLGLCNPGLAHWYVVFGAAVLVATASATPDIVIDAFRIESLPESEQAAGMASYVAAYRIGTLVSTAGALFLVNGLEGLGFEKNGACTAAYLVMAALVLAGMATALIAREPEKSALAETEHATHARESPLKRVAVAAYGAFADFVTRDAAFVVLAFVILFKFTDASAHGNAICAAHCSGRSRTHLSVIRRRLHRRVQRLAVVLRHLCAGRAAKPGPARLAAAPGAFRHACHELYGAMRTRHSGAPRSGEPGIHNQGLGLWIPALGLRPRPE
jgi:MFS transporter, PAT family, beta-lactamase induction signal transducer AmpG